MRPSLCLLLLCFSAWAQSNAGQRSSEPTRAQTRKPEPGPARQIGNGAANIGAGAAKGAGHLALGAAGGVGNLVTLHPIDAAVSVGKGAGSAGKDVTVGTVKGTAKIGKGVGRTIKKLF